MASMAAALSFSLAAPSGAAADPEPDWEGRVLHACETEEGYPPFTFRGADGHTVGYSVDLVEAAIRGSGLRLDVAFLPAKRCTAETASGQLDMVLEDNWESNLGDRFLVSDAIYDVTYAIFFDRNRFPQGLTIDQIAGGPARYHGCGILGEHYALLRPGQITMELHHYDTAFTALLSGRCDFFPDTLEHAAAFQLNGRRLLDESRFGWVAVDLPPRPNLLLTYDPGPKDPFFLFVRRDFPGAPALVARINATIKQWRQGKETSRVMALYTGGAGRLMP
jgi:ABC-type amino acid transport substrate-binding protein